MKILRYTLFALFSFIFGANAISQNAREIVKKADEKMQGEETSQSTMTMTIVRPTWQREITFKSWTKGRDYSLALVTAPAKEKGQPGCP